MLDNDSFVQIDNLDDAQQNAVCSNATRLCIVASAGSGKTRVIVKRIEHLCSGQGLLPENVVAITFTRKAGFELAKRLAKSFPDTTRQRPYVGTLHAFALSELAKFHEEHKSTMRTIVENPVAILEDLKIAQPAKMARAISWCKTRMISPHDITEDTMRAIIKHSAMVPRSTNLNDFTKSYERYQREANKRGLMDHDEILSEYCARLGNAEYAKSRQYLYRHLFVDEFQDTTPLHMEIYRRLVGENGAISVVGDPDQSIFSFAGSSDTFLNNFSEYFPGAHSVFLNTNYRSTKANVQVARSVVHKDDDINEIFTPRSSTVLPQVHVCSDEQTEASTILSIISSAHARGNRLNEIAVLVRTNIQKDIIKAQAQKLSIAVNTGRNVITDPVAAQVWSTIVSLRKKRRWKSIYDALDDIDSAQNITGELAESNSSLFRKLRTYAREYMELFPHDRHGDVSGFFEYLESQLMSSDDRSSGFSLFTFHQAKGLEFHTVVVAGFEKGLVPLYTDKVRKREEARLAYVALSRATDELHITRACVRTRHGQAVVQQPSEFLESINKNISEIDIRNDIFSIDEAVKRIADIRAKYLLKKL